MSQPAQRKEDSNDGNGVLNDIKQSSFFVNSKLASVDGSMGTSHPPDQKHTQGVWQTSGGSAVFTAENKPVNVTTNSDTCGHKRIGGSPDFFIPT